MAHGRVLHLGLDLLDRQLLDRHGTPCGNVDDIELTVAEDGTLYVPAILTGPGRLAHRVGWRRIGAALHRIGRRLGPEDAGTDRSRLPIELAYEIGPAVRVAVDSDQVAAYDLERWVSAHVIGKIPGARHAPE